MGSINGYETAHPVYHLDGEPIEDPATLEDQLTDEEKERVLALEPGEETIIGGGAFAEWTVERVR